MAAEANDDEAAAAAARDEAQRRRDTANSGKGSVQESDTNDEDSEDEDADEEPKLKYTRLTSSLGAVYRNGDATSMFMVAGDKMIVGTHNGNIHVVSVPSFQPLRTYNAHKSASVTALSVSPFPPPLPTLQPQSPSRSQEGPDTPTRQPPTSNSHTASPRTPRQAPVPNIPSNQIYIASASIDGHVCVSSLVDSKDVTLRNFARPLQAVALSPDYKNERSYLSGGLAGELILTTGGQAGVRSNANTSHAAAAAQGWLGAIGLGGHSGRDTILHSGEGVINAIKWSLSGKFVAWVNEHGIRIMRTNLHLQSADSESAWKRIAFIEKPNRQIWEEMAGVWKPRLEWIDDEWLESDEDEIIKLNGSHAPEKVDSTLPHQRGDKPQPSHRKTKKKVDKLVIGWGDAAWVVHVHPGGAGTGKDVGERSVGSAEIIHFLRFDDCIVSGISLYTPSLLIVLAYRTRDDDDNPITPSDTTPRRGMHRRTNGLTPELKLIDAATSDEIEVDSLTVSRYESLSAADYHLSTLYVPHPKAMTPAQRNALEAIGGGIWDAGLSAARIFSSGASIISMPSSADVKSSASVSSTGAGAPSATVTPKRQLHPHPNATTAGLKIFIQSPYDCVLAVKRDLADHFNWELEHENYQEAYELIEDHPEVIANAIKPAPETSPTITPTRRAGSLQEFFADENESQTTISAHRANQDSVIEQEKRRIGDLWVQQLVNAGNWAEAGKVAGRVLVTAARWEHWVWIFAQANRFNEIAPYIPTKQLKPPLPSMVYEVVLGHYLFHDRVRFKHLLEEWDPELFDVDSVVAAIKSKLSAGDVTEDSVEGDEQGRDWRILQDALAKLYLAGGHQREALRCYIRLQNADAAMTLIRDFHLVEAIRDDIPGFILLRVTKEQLESASLSELEEASVEAINVLVDEGCRGIVPAEDVVSQLQEKGDQFQPFLFFYLRALWKPQPHDRHFKTAQERVAADRLAADGQIIAEAFADLIVELFAEYDRPLLMEYLRKSQSYDLGKAAAICERENYIPELVHILSKTGQTKRALYLIIEKLSDVSAAIAFAKEQDDPDLWNDLLEYSMDKPHFIRGLLEEVGTAIDPIQLVKRIPEGLEIEGLRDGIGRMVREYEIQHSISEGVAKVLRGEVATGMDTLRAGQKRGVKFEIVPCDDSASDTQTVRRRGSLREGSIQGGKEVDVRAKGVDPPSAAAAAASKDDTASISARANIYPDPSPPRESDGEAPPGHCTFCHQPFTLPTAEEEAASLSEDRDPDAPVPPSRDTLVGFACGHVFHLSCLLPKTSVTPEVAKLLQKQLASDVQEDGYGYWGRSVGAKVAHAHLIRRAVGSGCVVCRGREEDGDA